MISLSPVILFDLGETLFEPLPSHFGEKNLLQCARNAGVDATDEELLQTFSTAKHQVAAQFAKKPFYRHRDFIGTAFETCCQTLGSDLESSHIDAYTNAQRNAVVENLLPRSNCFHILEVLRQRGHRLGIVSNIDDDWLTPLITSWQLNERVDDILSSETATSCKPDRRIFELACDRHGCAPSQALLVGDDEVNDIQGAKLIGITTVLLCSSGVDPNSTAAHHVIRALIELLEISSLS